MKNAIAKTFGIIGLSIEIAVAVGFGAFVILIRLPDSPIHQGIGLAWLAVLWLLLRVSLLFYLIDGFFSLVRSCRRIDPVFNTVLFLTTLLANIYDFALPYIASFFLKNDLAVPALFSNAVLCLGAILYLAIPILEIISIVRLVKKPINNGIKETDLRKNCR